MTVNKVDKLSRYFCLLIRSYFDWLHKRDVNDYRLIGWRLRIYRKLLCVELTFLPLVNTHITMSAGAGSETPSNYRFQCPYTALLAMQIYNKKSDFVELICEYEDDIVAKDKDGRFTCYQVTRSDYFRTVLNERLSRAYSIF